MPTVPNWIAKGYAYQASFGRSPNKVFPVTSWRATATQVVVTLKGITGERRFRLDDLAEVRRSGTRRWDCMRLVPPSDPRVDDALRKAIVRGAVSALKTAMDVRLDASSMSAEELLDAIGGLHTAAAKAMAELGELL